VKEDLLAETIDRTAEMTAHIVTRCLLRSFTLEEAIEAVEEAAHHVSEAGADEVEERIENKDPMALDVVNATAAIIRGIRQGHKENLDHDVYGT